MSAYHPPQTPALLEAAMSMADASIEAVQAHLVLTRQQLRLSNSMLGLAYGAAGMANLRADLAEQRAEHAERTVDSLQLELAQTHEDNRYDKMTGLLNKDAFMQSLEGKIENGERFIVGMMDLMSLKEINDKHGHAEGDRAIKDTARVIEYATPLLGQYMNWLGVPLRVEVAHLSGDEFGLLVTIIDDKISEASLENLREDVYDSQRIDLLRSEGVEEEQLQYLAEYGITPEMLAAVEGKSIPIDHIAQGIYDLLQMFYAEFYLPSAQVQLEGRGVAVGLYVHDPTDKNYQPIDADTVMRMADQLMYTDKEIQKELLGEYDRTTGERRMSDRRSTATDRRKRA